MCEPRIALALPPARATRLLIPLLLAVALTWPTGCAHASDPGGDGEPVMVAAAPSAARRVAPPPEATRISRPPSNSRITKVTVFSDRARVTRTAPVKLQSEPTVFTFHALPGWVDEASVRAATSKGRIVDVQVKRDYLARATDPAMRQAAADVRHFTEEQGALDDELKVLAEQRRQIAQIKAFSLEKLTKDMTIRGGSVKSYGEVVDFISRALRNTAAARREVERRRAELTPELRAAQQRLAELSKLTQLQETSVVVTLEGSEGEKAKLDLTYMLPGATWTIANELRSSSADPKSVELTTFAVVTQTSGEDWTDAAIAFSTQSATEAVQIPKLEALTLGETHTAQSTLKAQMSSFTRAKTAFEQQNRAWNRARQKVGALRDFERVYESNLQYLHITQGKTVQLFKSLSERGTTAQFKPVGKATIRSDGRSVRLRIGRAKLAAKQKIVAAPEQSMNAANTLRATNTSGQPLLPGKVALFRDGAFLGMTNLDFVADGEKFALFMNVEDQIKLSRVMDRKRSSLVRKRRNRMNLVFIVTVENLSSQPTNVSLADRIPVSQHKDIRIDNVEVKPSVKPDSQGLLKWDLELAAKEKRTFHIAYRVEYPPSLILQTDRSDPDEPAARRKQRRAIKKFEAMF